MAPEQATADPNLDHRVDLYALGVVAYELLAGHPPFEGPTPQAVLTAHVLDAPVPIEEVRPEITPALAALVMRALAKHPDERWRNADELLSQLEPLATPSGGTTPAGVESVRPPRLSLPWLAGALVVLAGLLGTFVLTRRPPAALPEPTQQQLTFTGRVQSAAISPDGQLLAFVAESAAEYHLQVQDVRGGAAITVARGIRIEAPSWSGDGSEVRYFAFDRDLHPTMRSVPRLGGAARTVATSYSSALTPDGSRLASLPQGSSQLTVTTTATGDSVLVELSPGYWYSQPTWSPDGRRVAFAGVEHSGNRWQVLVAGAPDFQASVVARDSVNIGAPGWGEAGRALYYFRATGHLTDLIRLRLTPAGTPDGEPRVIVSGVAAGAAATGRRFIDPVSITADGTRLVYTQRQDWSNLLSIPFGARGRAAPAQMLTSGSAQYQAARFSPDGRQFAFIRTESEGLSLQVMQVGGSASREIGRLADASSLAWSGDGARLLVTANDADSGMGLRIYPVEGGPTRTFFSGSVGGMAEWLSDSEIVVPRLGNRTLQVVVPASGSRRLLAGTDTIGWMLFPRLSPDRSLLAFVWNPGGGKTGVYLLRLGGSAARSAYEGVVIPVGWSRDGRILYLGTTLLSGDSVRVLAQSVSGGPARVVLTLPPGAEVVDIAPDGRTALANQVESRSDAWLIRLPPSGTP
jgi:Tol biopolymer transport system component